MNRANTSVVLLNTFLCYWICESIKKNSYFQTLSPAFLIKRLCPRLTLASLQPMLCPRASELLANYGEHVLVNNFKFGVIYQRQGQTSEEALFGNQGHSPALDGFLDTIGHRVSLASHQGYGGDRNYIQFGQTGEQSVYTDHCGKEVMYHVATLIPFSETDPQQLHRKRHINNDIVFIVFQEANTPFLLHTFIVVQPKPSMANPKAVTASLRPGLLSPPVFCSGSGSSSSSSTPRPRPPATRQRSSRSPSRRCGPRSSAIGSRSQQGRQTTNGRRVSAKRSRLKEIDGE